MSNIDIDTKHVLDELDGIPSKQSIESAAEDYDVEIKSPQVTVFKDTKKPKIQPIMRRTTFQARLGNRLDRISQRITDNQIRLASNPTDMIRIKVTRDPRSQDLISRSISEAEILPIILPPMEDIPMRRLIKDDNPSVAVPSLYPTSSTTYYELYAPLEVALDEDDLLIRLIKDPQGGRPYVLCLQIKEILGTLGYASFRYQKFWASLYDEALPKKVIDILISSVEKRNELGW